MSKPRYALVAFVSCAVTALAFTGGALAYQGRWGPQVYDILFPF